MVFPNYLKHFINSDFSFPFGIWEQDSEHLFTSSDNAEKNPLLAKSIDRLEPKTVYALAICYVEWLTAAMSKKKKVNSAIQEIAKAWDVLEDRKVQNMEPTIERKKLSKEKLKRHLEHEITSPLEFALTLLSSAERGFLRKKPQELYFPALSLALLTRHFLNESADFNLWEKSLFQLKDELTLDKLQQVRNGKIILREHPMKSCF